MFESVQTPTRLHHNAFVTRDMEVTRKVYEDVIGMPLVATWDEKTDLFGKERVYCHCFFALEDGGALALIACPHLGFEALRPPRNRFFRSRRVLSTVWLLARCAA
jgi:catechol 2,3-dioxygenase-like lactoylglutathione lyase family enzyme